MYFNARYYSQTLGRFVSADSIVPGAGNPQAFNRYAFVFNNPLRYIDPSGHIAECTGACDEGYGELTIYRRLALFGVRLKGVWTKNAQIAIYAAVLAVGERFAAALDNGMSASSAFRAGFGIGKDDPLELSNDCDYCGHGVAHTASSRSIRFNDLNGSNLNDWLLRGVNHVVHELGHAFNASYVNRFGKSASPYTQLGRSIGTNENLARDGTVVGNYGFASQSNVYTWQMHGQGGDAGTSNEIYADQFLGWTFNVWEGGPGALTVSASDRAAWMNTRMPGWLQQMTGSVPGQSNRRGPR
jgi:hypothetical protein